MIDLYIGDYKADVEKDFDVILSKNNEDSTTPHALYNSFSIGVVLPGTKNNDLIFNKLFSLNLDSGDSGDYYTEYDPFSKVSFILQNGGITVERGYIKLNRIINNRQDHKYDITLYGWFIDFWYRLQYDEDGKTLSLNDLVYGWQNEDEAWEWNRNFIAEGWGNIMKDHFVSSNGFDYHQKSHDIIAIPTYSGYRDNFDSKHILFDAKSYYDYSDTYRIVFPDYNYDGKTGYELYDDKYMLVECSRDIDEWEAHDLRSSQQRWGLRIGAFANAIISYVQRLGYNIDLSTDIRANRILNTGYFVFNTPNFIKRYGTDRLLDIDHISWYRSYESNLRTPSSSNIYLGTFKENIDTSLFTKPRVSLEFHINSLAEHVNKKFKNTSTKLSGYGFSNDSWGDVVRRYGLSLFRIVAGTIGEAKYSKDVLVCITKGGDENTVLTNFFNKRKSWIVEQLNALYGFYTFTESNLELIQIDLASTTIYEYNDTIDIYAVSKSMIIDMPVPIAPSVDLSIFAASLELNIAAGSFAIRKSGEGTTYMGSWFDDKGRIITDNSFLKATFTNDIVFDLGDNTKLYEGEEKKIAYNYLTKAKLFEGSSTPYAYLIDLLKLINARIDYDPVTNNILICSYDEYYKKHIVNIDELIDRSRDFEIDMNNAIPRSIIYGEKHDKTYVDLLNEKITDTPYGSNIYNTHNTFNAKTLNIGEDSIFWAVGDYNMSSIYFGDLVREPETEEQEQVTYASWQGVAHTRRLYNDDGSHAFQYSGVNNDGVIYKDNMMKACLFGENNKPMDLSPTILLFNGLYDNTDNQKNRYRLSDDVAEMYVLNEEACYIDTLDENKVIIPDELPLFNRVTKCELPNNIIGDSFNREPNGSLKLNTDLSSYHASLYESKPVQFGKESFDPMLAESVCRFPVYEETQANRLYGRRTLYVTAYVKKNVEKLSMRDIYFFDDRYFIIRDIEGGKVNDEFSKVKFMRIDLDYAPQIEIKTTRAEYDADHEQYIVPASGDFITIRVSDLYSNAHTEIQEINVEGADWFEVYKDEGDDYNTHMIWIYNNESGDQRRFTVTVTIESEGGGITESYVFLQQ